MSVQLAPRADFPLFARQPWLRYLDSAATSQKPAAVLDALRDFYETSNANPHRGAYALSVRATERYHAARQTVARFIGVHDSDSLIFTRGTTESLNIVARSWGDAMVTRDDGVVVTGLEHHANFVPWQQLAIRSGARFDIAELTADGRVDLDSFASKLTGRTRVVAVGHVSNALGSINPVTEIVSMVRTRSPDAIIVCDGAQGVPHLDVDVLALGVDFYAFSGHKLGGPMGIGALWGRRDLLEQMPPWQTGGDMIDLVGDERTSWNVLPHRLEAGTPNAADAVGLAAACDYISSIGMDRVRAHELELTRRASMQMASIEGVTVLGPPPEHRSGVVSFVLDDVHPHDLATVLDEQHVCIRAGHHCAQPLMRRLGVAATARASFWIYNDLADVDALVDAVTHARQVFSPL